MHIFNQPFLIEDHSLYVTMSIGVAMYPEDGKNAEILLKNADAAMYKAKHSGRNNYQYYTQDMTEHAFERIILETQLRESIEKNELEVYYQLQVDATTDQIKGMEALIRWNHPNLGIVSPDKFIPLAEDAGFIIAIDDWVMQQALVQFKKWYDLGYNPGVLSLNLSPLRLEQEEFIAKLDKALKSTSVQSSWLNLEITEGQIMRNPEKAIETLNKIHNLGIGLAIDDFGTGYSSLAYLKKLPIDKLKIDQSFVRDIPQDNDDVEITKTIISMTKNLSLNIIAEGVETQEQKEFLVANGCNEVQGYFYHKPSTARDVEKILVSGIN